MYYKQYLYHVLFISTGIGNSSETDYIRGFTHYATTNGYRMAIFNHIGALMDKKLTGSRMFTYGKKTLSLFFFFFLQVHRVVKPLCYGLLK